MIYTVTFNPALDYVVRLPELNMHAVNRCRSEEIQYGGKGINVSAVLTQLGCDTVALGFAAGFTGAALENGLRQMGVRTDFIPLRDGMTRINVKIKAGEETEINGTGPHIPRHALEQLYHRLDALRAGDVLVLAGSIPPSLPKDVYEIILARLDGRGIRAAVDATGELLVRTLPHRPFLIKPNTHELAEIFHTELHTEEEIAACAQQLRAAGARNVLVSMAGDGALLLDETGVRHRIGAPEGTVVNSVGAGDSMVAGFLAGFLESGDYGHALRLGIAAGSASAFSSGLAARPQVEALLRRSEWQSERTK